MNTLRSTIVNQLIDNPRLTLDKFIFWSIASFKFFGGFLFPILIGSAFNADVSAKLTALIASILGFVTLSLLGMESYHYSRLHFEDNKYIGYRFTVINILFMSVVWILYMQLASGADPMYRIGAFLLYLNYSCAYILVSVFKGQRLPIASQIFEVGFVTFLFGIIYYLISLILNSSSLVFLTSSFSSFTILFLFGFFICKKYTINLFSILFSKEHGSTYDFKNRFYSFANSLILYLNSWGMIFILQGLSSNDFFVLYYTLKLCSFSTNIVATSVTSSIKLFSVKNTLLFEEFMKSVRKKSFTLNSTLLFSVIIAIVLGLNSSFLAMNSNISSIMVLCFIMQAIVVVNGPYLFVTNSLQIYYPVILSFGLLLVVSSAVYFTGSMTYKMLPFFFAISSVFPRLLARINIQNYFNSFAANKS